MARADFVTSLVLVLLGLGVVAESWRMPRFTEFGSSIWSAPGIVPGMIGAALALMGGLLAWRSLAGLRSVAGPGGAYGDRRSWLRVALALALCIAFAGVMVGRVPFTAAAFLFIFAFILVFDLGEHAGILRSRAKLALRVLLAAAIAAAASLLIATIFQDVFFVRLP